MPTMKPNSFRESHAFKNEGFGRKLVRQVLVACSCGLVATGATLIEDFSYSDSLASDAGTATGGWGGTWGAGTGTSSARTRVIDDANLTYTGGGYAITQTGTGRFYGNFGGSSVYGPLRSANRVIADPMSGVVWFSFLVQTTDLRATNSSNVSFNGIQFNKDLESSTRFGASPFRIELANEAFHVTYGGETNALSGSYAFNTTHLVLGRWEMGMGNDELSLWINPANLLALGSPQFTASGADAGDALSNVGAIGYGSDVNLTEGNRTGYGSVDALRISDGDGDEAAAFAAVTGIPEPSTLTMLLGLGSGFLLRRRR